MTKLPAALALPLLLAGCGPAVPPSPPPAPPPAEGYRAREAMNYIDLFKTSDTAQWELAKERLVKLGPAIIPTLFAAMEESAGGVDLCCADVLKRMGEPVLSHLSREIQRGDAGYSGKALARRRAFRGSLIAVLGEMRGATSVQALDRILREDAWPAARGKAAFYLGTQKSLAGVPSLILALRDPDDSVRNWARGALKACNSGRDLGNRPEVWEAWLQQQSKAP